ncbi:MAG: type II secretion system protein [Lachnospiraceae bacterium]|nr:type II secretion system protein [Lachnospiraceae bacterium]
MKKNANKGFSLVELIIVIAIMAVLIGVLAPQFIKQVEKSRESTDLQNIEEYKTAIETWVAENGESATAGTITVNVNLSSSKKIAVATEGLPSGVTLSLADYGLDNSKDLKSSKWEITNQWQYSLSTYKWNTPAGSATYFNIDGTNK